MIRSGKPARASRTMSSASAGLFMVIMRAGSGQSAADEKTGPRGIAPIDVASFGAEPFHQAGIGIDGQIADGMCMQHVADELANPAKANDDRIGRRTVLARLREGGGLRYGGPSC